MAHKIKKNPTSATAAQTGIPEGEFKKVPIADIDPSPFNYRKVFPEKKMAGQDSSIAIQACRRMPRFLSITMHYPFKCVKSAINSQNPIIIL